MIFEKIRERLQKKKAGRLNLFCDGIDCAIDIINQVEAEYNNGWISVDDRLPEDDGSYIVCTETKNVHVSHYYKHSIVPHWSSKGMIIAWQPLPEPYVAIAKYTTPIKDSIMNHFTKGE